VKGKMRMLKIDDGKDKMEEDVDIGEELGLD
jgi:hypothetical protein